MDLGISAEQAANAVKDLHKALYKSFSKEYQQLIRAADPEDLKENENFFFDIPNQFNTEFINLLKAGCTMKQACEILKETYKL